MPCAVRPKYSSRWPSAMCDLAEERRIRFRIGINLGDVIAEEHDIFGDGVNVAARLEGLAEPGGICVSRVVRDQVRDKLDFAFEDLGEQQVKNIARPVRVYRVSEPSGIGPNRARRAARHPASCRCPTSRRLRCCPLPISATTPSRNIFADGIAEDIMTDLSRYRALFVIARNSASRTRAKPSMRSKSGESWVCAMCWKAAYAESGNRIRVTAQLVEAETGSHVWAERYDRDLADIFAVQDEITER